MMMVMVVMMVMVMVMMIVTIAVAVVRIIVLRRLCLSAFGARGIIRLQLSDRLSIGPSRSAYDAGAPEVAGAVSTAAFALPTVAMPATAPIKAASFLSMYILQNLHVQPSSAAECPLTRGLG